MNEASLLYNYLIVGGLLGLGLVRYLFPDAAATAAQAVIPHPSTNITDRG